MPTDSQRLLMHVAVESAVPRASRCGDAAQGAPGALKSNQVRF